MRLPLDWLRIDNLGKIGNMTEIAALLFGQQQSEGVLTEEALPELTLDLSLIDMLAQADWIVRSCMLLLLLASVAAWAIILQKSLLLSRRNREASVFEKHFSSGQPLNELAHSLIKNKIENPFSEMFIQLVREWESRGTRGARLISRLEWIIDMRGQILSSSLAPGMSLLAAIAASSPFIGLFGTVWGIMNSFRSIAVSQEAHLAVVAPGIAEALLATASGLVAAIPAVIAYNLFSSRIGQLSDRLAMQGESFLTVMARHLDRSEVRQERQ